MDTQTVFLMSYMWEKYFFPIFGMWIFSLCLWPKCKTLQFVSSCGRVEHTMCLFKTKAWWKWPNIQFLSAGYCQSQQRKKLIKWEHIENKLRVSDLNVSVKASLRIKIFSMTNFIPYSSKYSKGNHSVWTSVSIIHVHRLSSGFRNRPDGPSGM